MTLEKGGAGSSEKVQLTTKPKKSAKLNESTENTESPFSELTCSTCNRQFRTNSHQKNRPEHLILIKTVFSYAVRRTGITIAECYFGIIKPSYD